VLRGTQIDVEYALHGSIVFSSLSLLRYIDVVHHTSRILVIHVSTIFLGLRGLDFGPERNAHVDIVFAATFIFLRMVVLPMWWVQTLNLPASAESCMTGTVFNIVLVSGLLLHGLNFYWGTLILRKVVRKLMPGGSFKRDQGGEYRR